MIWDPKAARIQAKSAAKREDAEADAIRTRTEMQRERERAALQEEKDSRKRARNQERRKNFAAAARRNAFLLLPTIAVGSPAVIAWNGQYKFAVETMRLGVLSPLLPVAIEGSVLYAAYLTHQAVKQALPALRYRMLTWMLAGTAAGMNYHHGDSQEIGVALGLTSLLSIVLLELSVFLHKSKETKRREGRDIVAIRRALVRRIRYPRLSISAAALAASRGLPAEAAWRAAWIERFGVGPDATKAEREVAEAVLKREKQAAKEAAERGELTIVNGRLAVPEPPAPAPEPAAPAPSERPEVAAAPADDTPDWIRALEVAANGGEVSGPLLELPPALAGERADVERSDERDGERMSGPLNERAGERSTERPTERSGERVSGPLNERDGERVSGPLNERDGERPTERAGERAGERSTERPAKRRSRKRRPSRKQDTKAERERIIRGLLKKDPNLSGAQIQEQTGIPESSARRIASDIRKEAGGE